MKPVPKIAVLIDFILALPFFFLRVSSTTRRWVAHV
jgi:hypothetical protein